MCDPNFFLNCSGQNEAKPVYLTGNVCDCLSDRFWNGSTCVIRYNYATECVQDYNCIRTALYDYNTTNLVCEIDDLSPKKFCLYENILFYWRIIKKLMFIV